MLSVLVAFILQLKATATVVPESLRQEKRLLGQPLDRAALRSLHVWDPKTRQARQAVADEVVAGASPVLIVHLWATWCVPCKADFPLWREVGPSLERQFQRRVRVIHVALQEDEPDMERFIKEMGTRLPIGRFYLDHTEALAQNLRSVLNRTDPHLPMTLWLDKQRFIRKSIVGSVKNRRAELISSTADVMKSSQGQQNTSGAPAPRRK